MQQTVLTIILISITISIQVTINAGRAALAMYVCLCKGITDTQIRAAIQDGAGSMRDLRNTLGVASQCGKCGILARDIVRESLGEPDQDQDQLFYAVS